jgi:hypothetical protein
MINSFFQYTIINRKKLSLPIICGWVVLFGICAIAQKTPAAKNVDDLKTWKITSSRSGGIAGMIQGYKLDSGGHYNELSKAKKAIRKIEPATLREISKLILELNLPGAKMKTVKGLGIYDGIYESFTITLGSKDYKLEGSSFYSEKQVALTAKQQKTYKKLQELLGGIKTLPSNDKPVNQIAPIEPKTDASSKIDDGDTVQTKLPIAQSGFTAPLNPANQKMVFRYEYYWYKTRNRSWYIDEQGDIYQYSYRSDKKSFIAPPTLVGRVEPEVLAQKRKLIKQAAKGNFTFRRGPTDSGTGKTAAFLPDAETGEYREITLSIFGASVENNDAPEAMELLKWLQSVVPQN